MAAVCQNVRMKESSVAAARWPPAGWTGWLARRTFPAGADPGSPAGRAALGELEGAVSLAISAGLSALKFGLGMASGSIALLADAANNLADIGSSLIVALGFRWSRRPRDREHPFGHGRAEAVSALVLSLILIGVAAEVFRAGWRRLMDPSPLRLSGWMTAAVVATIFLKAWLARFASVLARATGSLTLRADAWNHGFDILCTTLVVLALVGARSGWPAADGWAGVVVSGFIGWTGLRFARQAAHTLIGEAPKPADVAGIERAALDVPGVRGAHDIVMHAYGDVRLISLHIEVDAEHSVLEAHELAERVEAQVAARLDARVVAHVDPVDRSHPAYARVESAVRDCVDAHPDLAGFHDLRIAGTRARFHLAVDLVARAACRPDRYPLLLREVRARLRGRVPEAEDVDIGVESELAGAREHREVCPGPGPAPSGGLRRGGRGPGRP